MKKILVLLGAMLISTCAGYSITCEGFECPQNPYDGNLSISNVTGTNFLAEQITNYLIKKQILKDSTGKYKVNLESYNFTALRDGKFKSLEITGSDTVTDGVYASLIKLKTLCDYNYIDIDNKDNTITFKENFGMAFAIQFSADDLNKTMQNRRYGEIIRRVNNIGNTYKMFNIISSSVEIKDNKLNYIMKVSIPILNVKKDITVETNLAVHNGEIIFDEASLNTEYFKVDIDKLSSLLNYLNPLEFSMKIMKNDYANLHIKEINITDEKINVSGIITVDKNVITEQ